MAGLNLTGAVQAYQQGLQHHQQQQEYQRQQRHRALADEANHSAAGVIESAKAEWGMSGAQGNFTPSDATHLRAAEARGIVFAKGGDWDSYMKNEAMVQNQRVRVRATALQQYEQDGDPIKLAQAVDPTFFNGKQIIGIKKIGGMPALDSIGKEATPAELEIEHSDGKKEKIAVDKLVSGVKMSLVDPVAAAQKEIETNFLRTKVAIETHGKLAVEREKGSQDRSLEDVKSKNQVGLATVKFGHDKEIHGLDNASRERVATGNNTTQLKVGAGNNAAAIKVGAGHDAASRYGADKRLDGVELRVEDGGLGGSSRSSASGFQRTVVGDDGYMYGIPRGGGEAVQITSSGKPIRSSEFAKRVDGVAAKMRDAPGNFSKSPEELRKLAEATLLSGRNSQPVPGLGSANSQGSTLPPLSSFKK